MITVLKKTNFTISQWYFKSSPKLLKSFNGTVIIASFVLPRAGVFHVIFTLDVNDSEFAKLSFG